MPSRHPIARDLISRGVFHDLNSFRELEDRLLLLGDENSKVVGDAFEIFVEAYLATQAIAQCEETWLVGQIPLQIRNDLILPHDAKGIDGVYRTKHASLVPYQVKFRRKRVYLTFTELAGFIGVTDRAEERVVFTNSNELADDIIRRPGLRVVRGIDFDRLEPRDLKAIEDWLKERPVQEPKSIPRDYQEEALRDISVWLAENDRAHAVMACGTGKTLIALWSTERRGARQILVLLPSLSLLRQTLQEWSKHNSWGADYSYICVCSDPTVKKGSDEIRIDPTEVDFRVDTDPNIVRQFLTSASQRVRVVFSTYQSAPVISRAMDGIQPFDIGIFDEAHKTTGLKATNFATALSDDRIRIKKRLFFPATPRHYDINKRDEDGDLKYVSMDDEAVYGPRAHTLTFAEAAKKGIICGYKVIVSLINKKQVDDFALRTGLTLVDDDQVGVKWVANELAVQRAIQETNASRVITFHSRVNLAEEFASETSHGINRYLDGFSVFHVNGEQRSSDREDLLHAFRDAPKGLITNARCLTEGIDVPAVDMVAFIDPRQSKIDIAQATGRAMRKPEASNKNHWLRRRSDLHRLRVRRRHRGRGSGHQVRGAHGCPQRSSGAGPRARRYHSYPS
jgi:predicted helicase